MYLLASFGILMVLLSISMVLSPIRFSNGIIRFSESVYFHPFEIISRLAFGVVFVIYANHTLYPQMILVIGYILIAVGIGLTLTPPTKHKQFAVWSAKKFLHAFRPAGVISFLFGLFIIYASIGGAFA